jgi:hypothetical protein
MERVFANLGTILTNKKMVFLQPNLSLILAHCTYQPIKKKGRGLVIRVLMSQYLRLEEQKIIFFHQRNPDALRIF